MSKPLSRHSIVARSRRQVSIALGDELRLLHFKKCVFYSLNPVGAHVWDLLTEPRSIGDLQDSVLEAYELEPEQCERDLINLLEKMLAAGLVDVHSA